MLYLVEKAISTTMKESFELSIELNASPEAVYSAWLNSEKHTAMTGGEATCSVTEGSEFTAWDGYIWGTTVTLVPNQKIVQKWRTTEFAEDEEDSLLEIVLSPSGSGCKLTLKHSHIPAGQTQYLKGWQDHYFAPMKLYFQS